MKPTSDQFGAYLVRAKLLSEGKIEDALRQQTILGGRLGTNLVELGYLTLPQLEDYLAQFYGMRRLPDQAFDQLNPRLMKTVPRRLIERFQFLPLVRTEQHLEIATMDPKNDQILAEIRGVLAIAIEPRIASEIRILFYLDHYFQIPAEIRFRSLFFHYRKSRAAGKELPLPGEKMKGPTPKKELLDLGIKPLGKGEELTDDGFEEYLLRQTIAREAPPVELMPEDEVPADFASPVELPAVGAKHLAEEFFGTEKEISLEGLQDVLEKIEDRAQIAALGMRFARQFVSSFVIFMVNSNLASGWEASGKKFSREAVRTWIFPLSHDSVLATVAQTHNHFLGLPSPSQLNERLLASLGVDAKGQILVAPVYVKKRLVNLVVAENGRKGFSQPTLNALLGLTKWLGQAYEQVIVKRKKTFQKELG